MWVSVNPISRVHIGESIESCQLNQIICFKSIKVTTTRNWTRNGWVRILFTNTIVIQSHLKSLTASIAVYEFQQCLNYFWYISLLLVFPLSCVVNQQTWGRIGDDSMVALLIDNYFMRFLTMFKHFWYTILLFQCFRSSVQSIITYGAGGGRQHGGAPDR